MLRGEDRGMKNIDGVVGVYALDNEKRYASRLRLTDSDAGSVEEEGRDNSSSTSMARYHAEISSRYTKV